MAWLPEMDDSRILVARTLPRIEVKIPVPVTLLPDVRGWVRVHPAHWRQTFPRRQVNNIYFDSPTFGGLNANLGGVGDRAKLRLRWYGACLDHVREAQLELKRKSGIAGWKEIVALPTDLALDLRSTSWSRLTAMLNAVLSGVAAAWLLGSPVPVLVNVYERDYFATADGDLRLTIDTNLRAYGQRALAYPNLSYPAPLQDAAVVELKAPNDAVARRRLHDALSYFPLSVDRYSKYVQGAIAGPDLA